MPTNRDGETKTLALGSGTWGGVNLYVYAQAAAVNVQLLPSDLKLTNFTLMCTLKKAGTTYFIHNDNLLNIGTYNMRKNAYERFALGIPLIPPGVATKNVQLFMVNIRFRSPVTVAPGDQLFFQYQSNSGLYGANADSTASYVDWIASPSTGHMFGIPQFKTQVVQANVANDEFINSDNVKHIDFINYDQANLANLVLVNVNLQSSAIGYGASFLELLTAEQGKYPINKPYRYSTTQALVSAPNIFLGLDWLPQCVAVFHADGSTLNGCKLQAAFNSANLNASQNWFMWDTITVTASMRAMAAKTIAARAARQISNL